MNFQTINRVFLVGILLGLLAATGAVAQTIAMTSTTLTSAVDADDIDIYVASAAGIAAPDIDSETMLYIDREAMRVRAVSGTRVSVVRGTDGTGVSSHVSGARVWLGAPDSFYSGAPSGSCSETAMGYRPRVVVPAGELWTCFNGQWSKLGSTDPVGAAATGVTAYEIGSGSRRLTRLDFTAKALYTTVATANEAGGVLLYTLPAGVVNVYGASMSIALTGSGTSCDADTPDLGLGTVIATGAVAVLGGTATFEDMLTGQTVNNLTGTAEVKTVANQALGIEAAGAHTVHLNIADGWAAGGCAITATGFVILDWGVLQ